MWAMKNIGDTFLRKEINSRQIILGSFWREEREQNYDGRYGIVHFLGDGRIEHPLYCFSLQANNEYFISRATVQRIHAGKRASSDICSWAGHIAECELDSHAFKEFKISTTPNIEDAMLIKPETPLKEPRHPMVVCMAPMYIYTDWEILITGIELWLAMGATKIIIPIQSASNSTYQILKEYERLGIVIIRPWTKWPILSDTNPNGLVLSRGIEESHVNCLFFVKPWADIVVFSDIDDFLLPIEPSRIELGENLRILRQLFDEHPQAGSLLFEHRDTQFVPPPKRSNDQSLSNFNFEFLRNSKNKMNCNVWRMKTRVVVNASRVDSVNMHETGIHRFGYVQTRVPCRQAHFYHLRHSHNIVSSPTPINLSPLTDILNQRWSERLKQFSEFKDELLNKTNTEYLEDFDRCMGAINDEHWTMKVSRCLTPHVCFSRLRRNVDCVSMSSNYEFYRSGKGYFMNPIDYKIEKSEMNCEAATPIFTSGNHYFSP